MTPLNLGDRATDTPLPVNSIQRKFSAALGELVFPAAGTVLGSTDPMRITVTPPRRCYWVVEGQLIQRGPSGTWVRSDWTLSLTPADLSGRNIVQCANTMEYTGGYFGDAASTEWYLEANTTYNCEMRSAIAGGTWYYMQEIHTFLFGYTIGDGVY